MPARKKQHFVPQLLLRNFAEPGSPRSVRMRTRAGHHVPAASIRGQCQRPYFYGRDGEVEAGLQEIEGVAAKVVQAILADEFVPAPYTKAHRQLVIFLALQRARTPSASARQHRFNVHFTEAYRNAGGDVRMPEENDDPREAMGTAVATVPLLDDLRLKMLRAPRGEEFVIGDAPTVFHNQWARRGSPFGSAGLASAGLQIFTPLSPEYTAVLFDTDVYRCDPAAADVVVVEANEVRALNALQCAACEDAVFYRSEQMRGCVDEIAASVAQVDRHAVTFQALHEERGAGTLLIQSHRPLDVDLPYGAFQLTSSARQTPRPERARRLRPEAESRARSLGLIPNAAADDDRPQIRTFRAHRPWSAGGKLDPRMR
jgi:hypothetical protein